MRKLMWKFSIVVLAMSLLGGGLLFAQDKVNINTANEAALITLRGIGQSKAQAIVVYRQNNEAFKTVSDIKKVPGIGEKIFEAIKENITVGEGQ